MLLLCTEQAGGQTVCQLRRSGASAAAGGGATPAQVAEADTHRPPVGGRRGCTLAKVTTLARKGATIFNSEIEIPTLET